VGGSVRVEIVDDAGRGDAVRVLELGCGGVEIVFAPGDEDDVVSVTGELASERTTDTAGCTGDEGSLFHGRRAGRDALKATVLGW